ncbi:hypothetical protein [Flavobacterium sp.]|nr:hypothetical protein [Flavobacterium sp.]
MKFQIPNFNPDGYRDKSQNGNSKFQIPNPNSVVIGTNFKS